MTNTKTVKSKLLQIAKTQDEIDYIYEFIGYIEKAKTQLEKAFIIRYYMTKLIYYNTKYFDIFYNEMTTDTLLLICKIRF